mmetsp:Transcript_68163/g.210907  ORF Transcript_68163/g.210907 Transcript_68163/m.210907 type:complete len:336 (+) Transcript_68163:23-1030(+)
MSCPSLRRRRLREEWPPQRLARREALPRVDLEEALQQREELPVVVADLLAQGLQFVDSLDGFLVRRLGGPSEGAVLPESDALWHLVGLLGLHRHPVRNVRVKQPLHHGKVLHVFVDGERPLPQVEHRDDAACAPKVGGLIPGKAQDHLGCSKLPGPDSATVPLVREDGAAKVDDGDAAIARSSALGALHPGMRSEIEAAVPQHDVSALQVRVGHTYLVQKGQTLQQLPRHLPCVLKVEPQTVVGLQQIADAHVERLEDDAEVLPRVMEGAQQLHAETLPSRIQAQDLAEHLGLGLRMLAVALHALHHLHRDDLLGLRVLASQDTPECAVAHQPLD